MPGDFNPHTREGCDPEGFDLNGFFPISIHTPVKGVTYPAPEATIL